VSQRRADRQRIVWPGFGLIAGAVLGAIIGLLFFEDSFVIMGAMGGGIGLVIGAIIDQFRPR
jgi:hypothetical protein